LAHVKDYVREKNDELKDEDKKVELELCIGKPILLPRVIF